MSKGRPRNSPGGDDGVVLVLSPQGVAGLARALAAAVERQAGFRRTAVIPAAGLLAQVAGNGGHVADVGRSDLTGGLAAWAGGDESGRNPQLADTDQGADAQAFTRGGQYFSLSMG
jgi:hypothetical protein